MPVVKACLSCGTKNRVPVEHLADTGKCGSCKHDLSAANEPIAVDAATFDEIIQGARVPVLVDFWATWCGPCRAAAPEVAKTASEMTGKAIVLKVDTESNQELTARYSVRGIPNFAVFRDGKLVHQQAGLTDHNQMIRWLQTS